MAAANMQNFFSLTFQILQIEPLKIGSRIIRGFPSCRRAGPFRPSPRPEGRWFGADGLKSNPPVGSVGFPVRSLSQIPISRTVFQTTELAQRFYPGWPFRNWSTCSQEGIPGWAPIF
jgi:hypothetical protein